ncbi:DNA-dependent protein kinase catalytic subunit [Phytophthora ramorum]|uniref:DNA-dependent protein kinase catalytic subunit n=1 Tax=Phytophthora ramorum TaxID=164328 RepID=UPI003095A827|nr:DNA-dependent protein kinase catalytic subunit [Phytophthora ramorum]
MATKVAERLEELTAFLAHQHAVDSVEETMDHLQKEVADAMVRSRASAQQCTILLFQSVEPPSLLRFVAASADFADESRKREISTTRSGVLELLSSFLKLYGSHQALTKQHVVDIFKTCQRTARTDAFNRVKAHAVAVVVSVLKYADKRASREDIEPRAYVDKLFYDIKFSKATQTAKGQMLELIGYLVEKFPQDVEESVPPLLCWVEDALEKQFSSNSPEMMLVNGLLFALARLLECDPERYKRDEGLRKKVYSYLATVFATTVSGNLSRYQVTKSSEIFIAKHAQMFLQEIGPNGHVWFSYAKFCCMSENKTIKEHAFVCSNAIFEALNAYLVEVEDDTRKKCLNRILKEVLPVVNDSGVGTSMIAFAIQCLGWLAQSIYVYLGGKGYGKIEEKLKSFGETLLALDAKATASRWTLCSQYVQCVGQLVQERRELPLDQGYVKFLGDLLSHLMIAYPQCLWKSKFMMHKSVARVFSALSKWTVIDPLVDRFVLQTLMLSISNVTGPGQAVVYHPDTGELVTNLLYDYEGFWLALLRFRPEKIAEPTLIAAAAETEDVDMKEPTNSKRTLQRILFDSTVKNIVDIIDQLNLSYQFDLQATRNGKNATGYTPSVPRDHSIMLNLTEFIERVLGKLPKSLLHPWIFLLMHQVFTSASKLPLVSSFYRIGTVLSVAMDDLKYFDSLSHFNGWGVDPLEDSVAQINVDDIFERVFSLCRHPGAVQRSGAAASISYFLRSLNEEDGTVLTSDETFGKHARTIQSLSLFGSKVLSSGIVNANAADKYASTFALVAGRTIQYGRCLPDNQLVATAALKAAAVCGWRITDVFVNASDRQLYGPVYNDVVHFIPTLAVWKQCASQLVSLSLENEYAINVLVDALHQVVSFKVYPVRSAEWDDFTKTLVTNIKQFVKNLEAAKADTQRTLSLLQVLRYFLELCQNCSEHLVEAFRIGPIRDIRDATIDLLKQRECSYLVKADLLRMLALLGPTSILATNEQHASDSTLQALIAFVFEEFPIVSTDVSRDSKDFDVFHSLFSELLGVIEQSNSIAYLKIIYSSLKEGDNHIFRAEIKEMLTRYSISLGSNVKSRETSDANVRVQLVELLDVLLDPALHVAIRKTLLEEVFTPLVECQTGETLQRFYLMRSATKKSSIIGVLAALISTSAEVTSGGGRIGVFVAYSLVEILYRLMDPEVVRLDLNSAFLGHKNGKGREFTMLVCKCASKVVTKTYVEVDDLTRLACCAAYGCLLTAVSRTQKQEKFFDQILFQPGVWSNILDPSSEYELSAETESPKLKRNGSDAMQFFTASSLSMDADTMGASTMTLPQDIDQTSAAYQNVEIELDEFNQHPCMMPLLRVLMQMKTDFGSNWGEKAMPGWMKKIFDVIIDPSTGLAVRLFLAKVVVNVPEVFSVYASSWLRVVMDTLVDATESQMVPEFNYLLRDCCNLVLDQWSDVSVASFKDIASRFINELIKLSPDRYNRIRNSNVSLVTSLITMWKDSVDIDDSDGSDRPLFPSALGGGEYTETNIDASWEAKTQSMAPLFSVEADTFSLFFSKPASQTPISSASNFTQNFGELGASQQQHARRERFSKRRAAESSFVKNSSTYEKKASKRYFQDQYALLKKREVAQATKERKQRQGQVSMKRTYRMGDFPDIQITRLDIVDPIMALCEMHTSSLSSSSRMELMQSLSSMVEIDELLMLARGDHIDAALPCTQDQNVTRFVNAWRRSPPSTGEDGMMLWSQHALVQNIIAGFLLDHGQSLGILSDEVRLTILGSKSGVMLEYANAAISCNILALASKMLKSYRELCNAHQLPKLSVQMVEVFVSHVLKLVDRQEQQSSKNGLPASSVKLITRYYETATKMFDNVEIMKMMETANASDTVAMGYLEAKTFASAATFYASNDIDDSLKEEYFSRSLDMFKISSGRINSSAAGLNAKLDEGTSAAFLRCRLTFIEFLNDLLFKRKMGKLTTLADRKTLTKLLAENVLGGMAFGDRQCAHYFPQICDLVAHYPDIVVEFEQQVLTKVPIWTCLQWSAQLMALLNGPIGKTIVAVLEKMAEKYPVALFYDFMVTCRSSLDAFKVDLHRLEVLLTNPVMEKFVTALRLIHHPELRLKEGLREIAKLIEDNRSSDARQKVTLLWKDCFSLDRPLLGDQIGRYNRDWIQKAKRDVEKIMGKDGTKLTSKTVNTAREWIMSHFSVTPGRYAITKDMKARIGDFAEWLEEFDHSRCSLELPGQYTARWGPPDPSTHIRILSFDSMLGVLASKQLPKRLTLHGSDEMDYTFLVKGGEDLRLDQRIEQLFGVMNQILEADPRCRDQKLSITTYDVIPMTQEIGILEWLDGTSTLKGVIEAQLQIDERCTDLKSNKRQKLELFNTTAAKAYESFLLKQRGASFSAKVVAPRSKDVVDQFSKVQAMIPADLLRRQLLGLGSNFEAFLLVRDHFLKSLAVFSACSYVLGIGDRHLDNFLFELSSGRVIGIDFGVSFGAGASVLPVPELIPFRYTRQMDFVFQPYDGANLLAQEMQAVFEALRSKRQVVESVMNVFLHEPLLDWQQSTTTHQKALFKGAEGDDRSTLQDSDVEMEEVEEPARASRASNKSTASPAVGGAASAWLPDVKIAIARRKLEGVSPGLLLKEELSQNVHLKQHMSKFHALIDAASSGGDGVDEFAATTSLAQAQELLKMATAPDLLGRTFQGWMPWL